MCPNTHSTTIKKMAYMMANGSGCLQPPSKSLLYFTRYVKWGIVQKDEPLSMKARNDMV